MKNRELQPGFKLGKMDQTLVGEPQPSIMLDDGIGEITESGPDFYARRQYHRNGSTTDSRYDSDGRAHSDGDQPAIIDRSKDGHAGKKVWCNHGLIDRDDAPALIFIPPLPWPLFKSEVYYKNGLCHRNDGPAEIVVFESTLYPGIRLQRETWMADGLIHRDNNLPAVILRDKSNPDNILEEEFFNNGVLTSTRSD